MWHWKCFTDLCDQSQGLWEQMRSGRMHSDRACKSLKKEQFKEWKDKVQLFKLVSSGLIITQILCSCRSSFQNLFSSSILSCFLKCNSDFVTFDTASSGISQILHLHLIQQKRKWNSVSSQISLAQIKKSATVNFHNSASNHNFEKQSSSSGKHKNNGLFLPHSLNRHA